MADEDLNTNPIFAAFLSSSLYSLAASNQLIVAVPFRGSLSTTKISRDLLESHVLKQSPYYRDEYLTINNKSVSYNSSTLVCKSGWSIIDRAVTIIAQELYYDEEYNSFPVLRISTPLDGKVPDDYLRSLQSAKSSDEGRPEKRSLTENEEFLSRMTGDSPNTSGIFNSINKFILQFNASYILVKGFIDHAGHKISDACARFREDCMIKVKSNHRDWSLRPSSPAEIHWSIESLVMDGIHKKLFFGLCEMYQKEEEVLKINMEKLKSTSQKSLGIRSEIVCHPITAINLLSELNSLTTPMMKLIQLENVSRAITQAVKDQTSLSSSTTVNTDTILSAEDIIPLTLYCLIQSNLPHIIANYHFLHYFAPNKQIVSLDHLFVHLANFQAAVQLIQAGEVNNMGNGISNGSDLTTPATIINKDDRAPSPRARALKSGSTHQRALSMATTNNGNLNNSNSVITRRNPSQSPTRRPSRISDEIESPVSGIRSQRPSVNRAISSPVVETVDDIPTINSNVRRLSSRASTNNSTTRNSRHATLPLPPRAASLNISSSAPTNPFAAPAVNSATVSATMSDDADELGEFLSSLKKANHVVTGNFKTVK